MMAANGKVKYGVMSTVLSPSSSVKANKQQTRRGRYYGLIALNDPIKHSDAIQIKNNPNYHH